jgi:chorismate mutase / prephenate dehydratase
VDVDIKELREKIDALDEDILELLNKRTKLALDIGELKADSDRPTYVPHREQEIVRRLTGINKGPFPNSGLAQVYREIISACRSLEKPLTIAYLGPEASFTHIASIKNFGSSVIYKSMRTESEAFREVETKRADYGVLAIENSTEGAVNPTLDAFVRTNLLVCAEILVQISHYLMAKIPIEQVKEVHSHPQVLGQCRGWLERNMRDVKLVAESSSAEAAKLASNSDYIASIGSHLAVDLYGLDILAEKIQDIPNNMTRFFVIGSHYSEKTGNDKTSVLFSVRHEAGSLAKALTLMADYGLNLTNIQLRPSGMKAWEYIFFVDMVGHIDDEPIKKGLAELEKMSILVKFLGSYPKADVDV